MKTKLVREVMTADPVTVGPETRLREVAEILSTRHISGVPVATANGRLLGVVSASDLVEFVAHAPGVPTFQIDRTDFDELDLVPDFSTEEDEPSSFFTDYWPDAGADVAERFDEIEGPEWNVLEEHIVEEIMTNRVLAVKPDTEVRAAARLMLNNSVHRLLVVNGGKLEGIVTAQDMLRLIAE